MSDTHPIAVPLAFNAGNIKQAITDARGDVFVASQLLGVTALRFQKALGASEELQQVYMAARETTANEKFAAASSEDFHAAVETRLSMYRVTGLDALHDLAAMPISDNSAQNQVKLAAAARLAGSVDGMNGGGDIADTLRALNDMYHKEAPRIRITRETIEVQGGERVINPPTP